MKRNTAEDLSDSSMVAQVVRRAGQPLPPEPEIESADGKLAIPTGSTMFNLALSDRARGGIVVGKIMNLIGDSHSGKTLTALNGMAEACQLPEFNKYELILDDVEEANEFDIKKMFGNRLFCRLRSPNTNPRKTASSNSEGMEDFHCNLRRAIDAGKPFIYVLDSFDALTSDAEGKKTDEILAAHDAGKEVKGTYAMDKPKAISMMLRQVKSDIAATQSVLIIISQTRDNIDPSSFQKRTRSGGRALKFYSTYEVWMAVGDKYKAKDRIIGADCITKCTKNKLTGKIREVYFPIYYSYGIDDIGSIIDFLVAEEHWTSERAGKNTPAIITAKELRLTKTRTQLIEYIEDMHCENQLEALAEKVWREIEESIKLDRRPRYE